MRKLENELRCLQAWITKQSWSQLLGVERCGSPVDTNVGFLYKITNESGDTSSSARPLRVLRRRLCSVSFYPWTLEPIVCSVLGKRFIEHAFLCNKLSHPPCPCPNRPDSLSLSLSFFFFSLNRVWHFYTPRPPESVLGRSQSRPSEGADWAGDNMGTQVMLKNKNAKLNKTPAGESKSNAGRVFL